MHVTFPFGLIFPAFLLFLEKNELDGKTSSDCTRENWEAPPEPCVPVINDHFVARRRVAMHAARSEAVNARVAAHVNMLPPTDAPRLLNATPQEGSLRPRSGLGQQSKEQHGLGRPRPPTSRENPTLAACGLAEPSQCKAETKVVSKANSAPPNNGRPSATTSRRRPSWTSGALKSKSLTITLVDALAPPSRHTLAAALSRAKPRLPHHSSSGAQCAMVAKHVGWH